MEQRGISCGGICAKTMDCKSYVEWAAGTTKFPKGECKLFKCPKKTKEVENAARQARVIRDTATRQSELTTKQAHKTANEIVEKAQEKQEKAIVLGKEVTYKFMEMREKTVAAVKIIIDNAQKTAATVALKANAEAQSMSDKAEKNSKKLNVDAAAVMESASKKLAGANDKVNEEEEKAAKLHKEALVKAKNANMIVEDAAC
jgi:hypothetical protein